jgi:hypothetical protein
MGSSTMSRDIALRCLATSLQHVVRDGSMRVCRASESTICTLDCVLLRTQAVDVSTAPPDPRSVHFVRSTELVKHRVDMALNCPDEERSALAICALVASYAASSATTALLLLGPPSGGGSVPFGQSGDNEPGDHAVALGLRVHVLQLAVIGQGADVGDGDGDGDAPRRG